MKTGTVRKLVSASLATSLAAVFLAINASAAALTKDPTKGYATKLPASGDSGILVSEDFETDTIDSSTGIIGKFAPTVPDDTSVPPATITVVNNVAHSGSKSLKVSARGTNGAGDPMGYNTLSYKDIGLDLAAKFVKDASNPNKTDNYFISAWIRNVDPNQTQYFWLQLQYGGSGEVWLPGQTYYEVKGDAWTQIGIAVVNGQTYYQPFIEDSTTSGIYAPRNGVSTWSAMKFITKNPRANPTDTNEKIIQTNGDFYVDDIVIWRVDDASKLVATLPADNTGASTATPNTTSKNNSTTGKTTPGASVTSSAAATSSVAAGSSSIIAAASSKAANVSSAAVSAASETESKTGGAGVVIGIILAAIVVLGGGGFCLYWFVLRKKTRPAGGK